MKKPQGVVLWKGKSLINHKRVVCIATNIARKSKNPKTGQLIQTYILVHDESPIEALRSGGEEAVCGNCRHRPVGEPGSKKLGSCYVNIGQGPLAVWKAYNQGLYPVFERRAHASLFKNRMLRLGTYGDPAAVPLDVWKQLCHLVTAHVGYTHQWRSCPLGFRELLMASCETIEDRLYAQALGYRTFRVRLPEQELEKDEFMCPASAEAGKRLTCQECKACSGSGMHGTGASPSIVFHASPVIQFNRYKTGLYRDTIERKRLELTVVA